MATEVDESNLIYKNRLLKWGKNTEKFIPTQPYPKLAESNPPSQRLS